MTRLAAAPPLLNAAQATGEEGWGGSKAGLLWKIKEKDQGGRLRRKIMEKDYGERLWRGSRGIPSPEQPGLAVSLEGAVGVAGDPDVVARNHPARDLRLRDGLPIGAVPQ